MRHSSEKYPNVPVEVVAVVFMLIVLLMIWDAATTHLIFREVTR